MKVDILTKNQIEEIIKEMFDKFKIDVYKDLNKLREQIVYTQDLIKLNQRVQIGG